MNDEHGFFKPHQQDAALRELAVVLASYYGYLREAGLPDVFAMMLTRDYQTWELSRRRGDG